MVHLPYLDGHKRRRDGEGTESEELKTAVMMVDEHEVCPDRALMLS